MNLKELVSAVEQVAEEKNIKKEKAFDAVEAALAAAYKKEYRKRTEIIKCRLNIKTGELNFWQVKTVVAPSEVRIIEEAEQEEELKKVPTSASEARSSEESQTLPRYNADRHIFIEEAKMFKSDAGIGEDLEFPLETHGEFGRIAAQTAKQVILQSLREAEKESIKAEFAEKENEIVSGVVQRFERGNVHVDLGRVFGVMFANEAIPGEHCRPGQRMKFYVLAVQEEERNKPGIILSRAHPEFVKKLFEIEVPEIIESIVEIKLVAREPGSRTKIAVYSYQDGVDPIGAVVGQRGTRVMAVTNELGNEKIDVIEWSQEPEKFIANALSPAKVKLVEVFPRREAKVFVPEDQLSLAIGKFGQNVRLAARLTGWKIDVRSQSRPEEIQEGGIAEVEIGAEVGLNTENTENIKELQEDTSDKQNKVEE